MVVPSDWNRCPEWSDLPRQEQLDAYRRIDAALKTKTLIDRRLTFVTAVCCQRAGLNFARDVVGARRLMQAIFGRAA